MHIPLSGDTVPTRTNGVCAEFYPTGDLKHLGCYRDGKPRGWVLDLAEQQPEGCLTKREIFEPEEGDENSSDQFRVWAENWATIIFEEAESKLRCAFCSKTQSEVRKLIAGPTSYICDECVQLCQEILASEVV